MSKIILDKDDITNKMNFAKEQVKYWEERYRNTKDGFNKKSFKRQITIWLTKFETYRSILNYGEEEE